MVFEDLVDYDIPFIITLYHWQDTGEDGKLDIRTITNDKPFYVCDDMYSWCSPHIAQRMRLYEVDCVIRNCFLLLGQFATLKDLIDTEPYSLFFEKGEYDSVFYTPHEYGHGVRQGVLLKPKDQIMNIRHVEFDYDEHAPMIKKCLDEQNRLWGRVLSGDGVKNTTSTTNV